MKPDIFHFDKKSEIIIYGYGKIGQDLYRKLTKQGFKVIGIIDKNKEQFETDINTIFLKCEELNKEYTKKIFILTFQNILEHERVVKFLIKMGAQNIVYLNRSNPEKTINNFRIYNQLINCKIIKDFEFPIAQDIDNSIKRNFFYREELNQIITEVSSLLLFTDEESPYWPNINISASKEYNAIYNILLNGRNNSHQDFQRYTNTLCGTFRTREEYLQDRSSLCQMMLSEYNHNGIQFFRNSPIQAKLNINKQYFNIKDGLHRALFLYNQHICNLPVIISKEDFEIWYNYKALKNVTEYIEKFNIQNSLTPIYHPAINLKCFMEKNNGTAFALHNYFRNKETSILKILDLNSNLSYFAQIFHRMGASKIVSAEPDKTLFNLAVLLNQLFYTNSIEMYNNVEELDLHEKFDVLISVNDLSNLSTRNSGTLFLQKINSISPEYLIYRSLVENTKEREFILSKGNFKFYQRLNVEIVEGQLSEIGIYEK